MILKSTLRRAAAYAAMAALALQALWPLLAQARPGDSLQVPLCSVDGATHLQTVKIGKTTPLDERAASHGEHCKLCVSGGDRPFAAVSSNESFLLSFSATEKNFVQKRHQNLQSAFLIPAQPRAPPQVS